jgi:protein-disulfide isomerase
MPHPARRIVPALLLACGLVAPAASAPAASDLTPAERARIEAVVRDYLMNNPEVMIESLRAYETARREQAERAGAAALAVHRTALEDGSDAPVVGNAQGDVTIVEFFDYQCGYCKRVLPTLQEVLKTDKNVRLVLREFPILGPDSVTASKAALAVWKLAPEKYLAYHVQLMQSRGGLTEERLVKLAEGLGVDGAKLRATMADEAVAALLRRNLDLGRKIDLSGTPAFVIGGRLVPGAIDADDFREMIVAAREK